jgi:hypothetical protein
MKTTNKIKTDFDCRGLAYANNHLCISDITSVYIYTMSGRKLKQFNIDKSGQKKLFYSINSLAVSKDTTRIYVADCYKGLIVLDNNGQIVTTFNGEKYSGLLLVISLKQKVCCFLDIDLEMFYSLHLMVS